jgi:hypothetical protein
MRHPRAAIGPDHVHHCGKSATATAEVTGWRILGGARECEPTSSPHERNAVTTSSLRSPEPLLDIAVVFTLDVAGAAAGGATHER